MGTTGIFVIPLCDMMRTLEHFEDLLAFYPDGLKGVVRDILPMVDSHRILRHRASGFVSEWESATLPLVIDKIMRTYDNSAEAVVSRFMENTTAAPFVELVIEKIYREVQLVMGDMFGNIPVTVSKDEGCWLGKDFVAWITIHEHFVPSGL